MINPFREDIADAWREQIDVPSINEAATHNLQKRILDLAAAGKSNDPPPRSQCVLIFGPAGSGKTHLFTRLRKKLGMRALFFYTRPELGAQANPRYLLAQLVDAMRLPVPGSERTQLDLMAASHLSAMTDHPRNYPLSFLENAPDEPSYLIDKVLDAAEKRYPHILPKYLERLLQTPFLTNSKARRAAYTWLSGRAPSEGELQILGEAQGLGDEDILPALRTLGFAAAFGAPLVLVLDQLENLADDDPEHARIFAHAQLVSELYDTVPGMLILQMAVDSEWTRAIRPILPLSLRQRVEQNVVELTLPTKEQSAALVAEYLNNIPEQERKGPFPWPLPPKAIDTWTSERMTPRALIIRCRRAFEESIATDGKVATLPTEGQTIVGDRLAQLYSEYQTKARAEIDTATERETYLDPERIASGLLSTLALLGIKAGRMPGKRTRPDLRISAENEWTVIIAQQNHYKSLGAVISEALKIEGPRVALMREIAFEVPLSWKQTQAQLAEFSKKQGATLAWLGREELTLWLAIEAMAAAAKSKDLTDEHGHMFDHEQVLTWLRTYLQKHTVGFLATVLQKAPIPAPTPPSIPSLKPESTPEKPSTPPNLPKRSRAAQPAKTPQPKLAASNKIASPPASTPTPLSTRDRRTPNAWALAEAEELEKTLLSQLQRAGISATVANRIVGARLIRLEIAIPRQRVTELDRLASDVEHKLADRGARYERLGPRRYFTAPRAEPLPIALTELIASEQTWLGEKPGRFILGEYIDGEIAKGDLADGGCCHLLIAGQTGSGKSVLLRALALSLTQAQPPSLVRLTLGDPKRVTFGPLVEKLQPYLAAPVGYDTETIVTQLEGLLSEMDARYSLLEQERKDDLHQYNKTAKNALPVQVVIIDEFADLVLNQAVRKTFLHAVKRIGNMGRAAGIHLILSTQRPDKSTVPGEVKANLVGKIALKVQTATDSRIVVDDGGAEKLLGKGDMLVNLGHGLFRAQAPIVD